MVGVVHTRFLVCNGSRGNFGILCASSGSLITDQEGLGTLAASHHLLPQKPSGTRQDPQDHQQDRHAQGPCQQLELAWVLLAPGLADDKLIESGGRESC